jgi:hypothetical protein
LSTLTVKEKEANRGGPQGLEHYSTPWENGFDDSFSIESKVRARDPMLTLESSAQDIRNRFRKPFYGQFLQ